MSISSADLAAAVSHWAWYPAAETLWSRSREPFDFRKGDRRWLAAPTEDGGVRCRVENDQPPGNAGFCVDLGPIQDVERVTIESATVHSGGDADQQLLAAIYLDVSGDGDYFQWDPVDRREEFVEHGADLEGLVQFPADGAFLIDDDTELDLVPPFEEHPVTFGALRREAIDGVGPLTRAAVQISVVGGGEGTVEEALLTDLTVERPDPIPDRWWQMYSYDMFNRGYNTAGVGPSTPVEAAWTFDTDGAVRSSPAVVRGTVYVGSDDGNVYAIDATSGEEAWRFATHGPVVSSPAVLGRVVYVGSDDGNVYALSASTGEELWNFETGDSVRSSPTVEANSGASGYDDVVAVGSDDGSMYLLDAVSGQELYTIDTDGAVTSAPVILYTRNNYWEVGCDSADGRTYWWVPDFRDGLENVLDVGAPVHAPIARPPGRDQNIWYRATDEGTLQRLVRTPVQWRFEADGAIRTTPALTRGLVFVGSRDGHLYAVETSSGELRWAYETDGAVDSSPAIADGTLHVGSADGTVYGLGVSTGDVEWTFQTGDAVVSSPAVVDGTVYVGSNDRSVYALSGSSG